MSSGCAAAGDLSSWSDKLSKITFSLCRSGLYAGFNSFRQIFSAAEGHKVPLLKGSEARSNALLQVLKKAAATSYLNSDESVRELVAKHEPGDRAASRVSSSSQTEDALSLRSKIEQIQHGKNDIDRSVGSPGNPNVLELRDS
nr:hypothetical protein LTR18_011175 [Exophiala xenobiotica]